MCFHEFNHSQRVHMWTSNTCSRRNFISGRKIVSYCPWKSKYFQYRIIVSWHAAYCSFLGWKDWLYIPYDPLFIVKPIEAHTRVKSPLKVNITDLPIVEEAIKACLQWRPQTNSTLIWASGRGPALSGACSADFWGHGFLWLHVFRDRTARIWKGHIYHIICSFPFRNWGWLL